MVLNHLKVIFDEIVEWVFSEVLISFVFKIKFSDFFLGSTLFILRIHSIVYHHRCKNWLQRFFNGFRIVIGLDRFLIMIIRGKSCRIQTFMMKSTWFRWLKELTLAILSCWAFGYCRVCWGVLLANLCSLELTL